MLIAIYLCAIALLFTIIIFLTERKWRLRRIAWEQYSDQYYEKRIELYKQYYEALHADELEKANKILSGIEAIDFEFSFKFRQYLG